ncbi:hypothetical protein DFP72DRAFT_843845 [Ephemerocybe angulata]|uniref:Uncharacterized protein n=1 Tax=Ephemerocybe angulata TaxID=980116 RepID=A0A8H6I6H8_9AGAR|nr:hypothetical protein DFP72DRAFT_843845 [Tulosesus angulatus]
MAGHAGPPNVSTGRSKELPTIEKVETHPQVKGRRPIYVVKGLEEDGWMKTVLDNVAPKKCPKDRAEAVRQGYVIINAADSPVILWRDMAGTQRVEDDKIVVWTRAGLLGPRAAVGAGKAQFDSKTGRYTGGVAFERNNMAVSLEDTSRAYPSSTSHQSSRGMNAPHRGRKNLGMPLDEHGELVRDIQKVGVVAGMAGLADGPEGLKNLMDDRADYLNIPRVGDQVNSAYPTLQMNLASAAEPDEASDYNLEKELQVKPIKRRNVTKMIRSGKAISTAKPIKSGKVSAKTKKAKKSEPTKTAIEVRPTRKLRRRKLAALD